MDPDDPRRVTAPIELLGREDLAPYSVAELEARIAALDDEAARTRRIMQQAVNHRATADALFKP